MITPHFDPRASSIIKVRVMPASEARDLFGPVDGIVVHVDDDYLADCSSPLDLAEAWGTRLDAPDLE